MFLAVRRRASISVALQNSPFIPSRSLAVGTSRGYGVGVQRKSSSGVWGAKVCRAPYSTTLVSQGRPLCSQDGCLKQATFGIVQRKPMYCKSHKADNMEDVVSARCTHPGCKSRPKFNHPGEKEGLFCVKHKLEDMEDVLNTRCLHQGCRVLNPVFNYTGEKKGLYCCTHKLEDMENIISPRCAHVGCETQSGFNYPGERRGIFCVKHKREHMEDVTSKRCAYEGCKTQPVYNSPGEKRGLYCWKHKLDGMKDVKTKQCGYEGCKTYVGGRGFSFCSKHRQWEAMNA